MSIFDPEPAAEVADADVAEAQHDGESFPVMLRFRYVYIGNFRRELGAEDAHETTRPAFDGTLSSSRTRSCHSSRTTSRTIARDAVSAT